MITLDNITSYLDTLLSPHLFQDASLNALQVESSTKIVRNVGLAVDAGLSVIDEAIRTKCELLIVHHGLLWGSCQTISGRFGKKIRALVEGGCSLYASHLPLDAHPEVGNNFELARFFALNSIEPAFPYKGACIGALAKAAPQPRENFIERARMMVGATKEPLFLPFGPPTITRVAIVSGSGVFGLEEAKKLGADIFISGEPKQEAYHLARELEINALFAGHYATETFGVRAVGKVLEKEFGVSSLFIDCPTGI